MKPLVTIVGPTASGKTSLAVALAREIGGEILSGDSRQVYRGMDIGTGKDLKEYGDVPHHLIDICQAGEKYNLFRFQKDFHETLKGVLLRGAYPILCGGTGLYVESIVRNYQLPPREGQIVYDATEENIVERAAGSSPMVFGIDIPRDVRREKISRRLKERLEEGMVKEVEGLLESGISAEDLIYYGLEYKYVTEYCVGRRTLEDMVSKLEIAIHQFAKRQMTWFRGMERRGVSIHWLAYDMPMKDKVIEIKNIIGEKND